MSTEPDWTGRLDGLKVFLILAAVHVVLAHALVYAEYGADTP